MKDKMKKFGAWLLAAALSFAGAGAAQAEAVKVADQAALEAELVKVNVGGSAEFELAAGEFTTYGTSFAQGKKLTLIGALGDNGELLTKWKYGADKHLDGEHGSDYSFGNTDVTFRNLELVDNYTDTSYYRGFVRATPSLRFENCTIRNMMGYLGSGDVVFKDCTFDVADVCEYCIKTYSGSSFVFDGCTFKSNNKGFVQVYCEKVDAVRKVTVKNCTFIAGANTSKSAIYFYDYSYGQGATWDIDFVGKNVVTEGHKLWGDMKIGTGAKTSISINGVSVWENGGNVVTVEDVEPVVASAAEFDVAPADGETEIGAGDVAVVEAVMANTAVGKVETGIDVATAGVSADKKYVSVVLTSASVSKADSFAKVVSMTFEVTPCAVKVAEGSKSVEVIPNSAITAPITFRFPVDAAVAVGTKADVTHNGVAMAGDFAVAGDDTAKYIEVASDTFSTFAYTLKEGGEEPPTETIALSGTGTSTDPFLIPDLAALVTFREWVNAGHDCAGQYFKVTANIDLSSVESWKPIGTNANPFSGVFDGQNHTISNLKHTGAETASQVGLFGLVSGVKNADYTGVASVWENETFSEANIAESKYTAVVKNLVLDGVAIENTSGDGSSRYTGALAGEACFAYIANITVSGSVSGTKGIGGVVGTLNGSIAKGCVNSAMVVATGYNAGGIAGGAQYNKSGADYFSAFVDCSNSGNISTTGSSGGYTGGIVGMAQGQTCTVVKGCSNTGSISDASTGGSAIGGIVGQGINTDLIVGCENSGTLTTTANVGYAGGIAGKSVAKIYSCANKADITISAGYLAGIYNYDRGNGGAGGLCVDCVNAGTLTNINPDGQTYPIGGDTKAAIYSGRTFADVAEVNALIATLNGVTEISFVNCTVTDKTGALQLQGNVQRISSDTELCAKVNADSGNKNALTIDVPKTEVVVTANRTHLNVKGAGSAVMVPENVTIVDVKIEGDGASLVNNGTITRLNLAAAGTVEAVNNGTLNKLGFGGAGTYNVVNNGMITHQTADSNPYGNEHTVSTIVAAKATIDNYGTIEAKANASGICSYALLFYNGANVVVNSYKDSVISADNKGSFIACGSAEAVTLNVEGGAVFKYGDTPFTPTSFGKLTVQPMAKPVAKLNGTETYFYDLNEAFTKANNPNNAAVIMLRDCAQDVTVNNEDFCGSFYLKGHKLTGKFTLARGTVTIVGEGGTIENTGVDEKYPLYLTYAGGGGWLYVGDVNVIATGENGIAFLSDAPKSLLQAGTKVYGRVVSAPGVGGSITIDDGEYFSKVETTGGHLAIRGGLFSVDPSAELSSGYKAEQQEDGRYKVVVDVGTDFDVVFDKDGEGAYLIKTAEDLALLRRMVNVKAATSGKVFKQAADIDMENWQLDACSAERFNGTYDGGGFVIANLNIDGGTGYAGLFGYTDSGVVIRNATISNATVKTTGRFAGAFVGYGKGNDNKTSVINCRLCGEIDISAGGDAAGIMGGGIALEISGCTVDGTGTIAAEYDVGGIIGLASANSATISDNLVKGVTIRSYAESTADGIYVGGVIGRILMNGSVTASVADNVVEDVRIENACGSDKIGLISGCTAYCSNQITYSNNQVKGTTAVYRDGILDDNARKYYYTQAEFDTGNIVIIEPVAAVAEIVETGVTYPTLVEAAEAAVAGNTIKLLKDYTVGDAENVAIKDGVAFTADTYTLTCTGAGSVSVSGVTKFSAGTYTGTLVLGKVGEDTTLTTDGLSVAPDGIIKIVDGSAVTLSGAGFTSDSTSGSFCMILDSVSEKNENPHAGYTLNLDNADGFKVGCIYLNGGSQFNVANGTTGAAINWTGGGDGYLNVYGGTVTIDETSDLAPTTINLTGLVNVKGILDSCTVNIFAGITGKQGGEIKVDGGAFTNMYGIAIGAETKPGDKYYIDGADKTAKLTLIGGKVNSKESIDNRGLIVMDAASSIETKDFTGNNGVVQIDMTGASANSYTLISASGTVNYGTLGTNYKFAEGKDNGYELKVVGNSIVAEKPAEEEIDVPTDKSGEAVIPVKVPTEVFEQKQGQEIKDKDGNPLPAPTTTAEKQQFLVTEQPNGLKVWQNVAMGVNGNTAENALATISREPTAEEKAKAAEDGKTIDIVINTPISEFDPPETTGVTVSYKLLRSTDGGKIWTALKDEHGRDLELEKPEFPTYTKDDTLISEGDTFWKFQAVFTSQAN